MSKLWDNQSLLFKKKNGMDMLLFVKQSGDGNNKHRPKEITSVKTSINKKKQ
jgi:hypothetical protein